MAQPPEPKKPHRRRYRKAMRNLPNILNELLDGGYPLLAGLSDERGGGVELCRLETDGSSHDDWDDEDPPPPEGMEEWHYGDNFE